MRPGPSVLIDEDMTFGVIMKRSLKPLLIVAALVLVSSVLVGCSTVIYNRGKDETKPMDEGVETSLKLQGPKAVMQTKF